LSMAHEMTGSPFETVRLDEVATGLAGAWGRVVDRGPHEGAFCRVLHL
jgi:hypothetical protein